MKQLLRSIAFFRILAMSVIPPHTYAQSPGQVVLLAQEHHAIWNGVTVNPEARIFVNYPALSPKPILAVGEVEADGTVRPYPGGERTEEWRNLRGEACRSIEC
jgi:hypothetical protein